VLRVREVFIPDPDPYMIPDPKGFHLGSRILMDIKRGMKNKSNLFLAPYGFRSKAY
jgi:hypothetical protein